MTSAAAYQPDSARHRWVNWLNLKGFGQSPAGALTMATPFIGYILLYHDAVAPWLGGLGGFLGQQAPDTCGPWISFVTRLNMLYLGLLALGLGTILYRAFAHVELKRHASESDYVERNAAHITLRNLRSMFEIIAPRRPGLATDFEHRAPWLSRKAMPSLAEANAAAQQPGAAEAEAVKIDVMRSYFNVLSRYSARPWCWAASLLYGLGFVLLALPGLFFTARVLCTMVD